MKEEDVRKLVKEQLARQLNELRRVDASIMEDRGTPISEALPSEVANAVGEWLRKDLSSNLYWFTEEDFPWSEFWADAPFREEKTVQSDGKEFVLGYVYGGMAVVLERGSGAGIRVWMPHGTKERAEMDYIGDYMDDSEYMW